MPIRRVGIVAAFAMAGFSPAHADIILGQGTWETTLLGRDINGRAISATDTNAVFAYDTVLRQRK